MTDQPHFTRAELCRSRKALELGISNEAGPELNANLARTIAGAEKIRTLLGFPMTITSGYRCPALNIAVGGAHDSQHVQGQAIDFTCPAFGPPEAIVKFLAGKSMTLMIDQLICEPGWVHVSFAREPRFAILRKTHGGYEPWRPIG